MFAIGKLDNDITLLLSSGFLLNTKNAEQTSANHGLWVHSLCQYSAEFETSSGEDGTDSLYEKCLKHTSTE